MVFDIHQFRDQLKNKIEKTEKTLQEYRYTSKPNRDHMCAILTEEISTLKWVIQKSYEQYSKH